MPIITIRFTVPSAIVIITDLCSNLDNINRVWISSFCVRLHCTVISSKVQTVRAIFIIIYLLRLGAVEFYRKKAFSRWFLHQIVQSH